MEIYNCGIHGYHEVSGIDEDELYLHWSLRSNDPDACQKSYRITLATIPSAVESGDVDQLAWDTGRVNSDAQRNIHCKPGDGFRSTTSYYWRVTVWNQKGESFHSAINHFFTAYPRSHKLPPWSMNQTYMPHSSLIFKTWFENEEDRWKGVWIGDGSDKPVYIRKTISLKQRPVRAIAFASGLGHFNLSVNGEPASDHVLDPGWTNYHRTVQFVAYDLTPHLKSGDNAIGAHVGNGFYAGDQGDRFFWPMYEDNTYVRHGNELCFFCELHLFYDDGSHDCIISGPDWKIRRSATTLANIYASEDHDRRAHPAGWNTPSFDDSSWSSAKPLTGPRGELRYQHQPPVTLQDTFESMSRREIKPGMVSFDLGQNSSMIAKIAVTGKASSEVIIRYAESVAEDGNILMPDPLFKEFETKVYSKFILAGAGEPEIWMPDFCFTSAPYIQVEGVSLEPGNGLPVIHSAIGRHVSSASRPLGTKTDKEDVNQLISACYWSFVSNLFSYHTDCPQIEKFGWLEVTHLLAPATQYIRDFEALHSKILEDILEAQELNGFVPNMAPDTRYMCGPMRDTITWGCAICFIPDILKRYYGSTQTFKKVYPAAVRYMEYIKTKERKGGLIEHGLGDWGRDIAFGNHQANIETAVYYKCLRCCEMMARELGLEADTERFDAWARRIHEVYNKHLLVTSDDKHEKAYYTSLDNAPKRDRTAVNQAVALQFGMVPSHLVEQVQEAFLEDVADCRIRSGEIGLRFLWLTLADLQRPDIVLAMARQEEHPSYMRFLRRGETTLLEFWQDECRSKCHDMLGTIYEWFYVAVLGVKPMEDAYKSFEIKPPYDSEFGDVEGSFECPYGLIAVQFRRVEGGKYKLEVTVPMSTTAHIHLPGKYAHVKVIRREGHILEHGSSQQIHLGHGSYVVEVD